LGRKQIIGSVLISLDILGLFILVREKGYYDSGVYGFSEEMFHCFVGIVVFLVSVVIGALIFRKRKLIYWSMTLCVTSITVGLLGLWALLLTMHPTEESWGAFAQSLIYCIIGILLSHTAVLLAVLAWSISRELRGKLLSWFKLFCLFFNSVIVSLFILTATCYFVDGGVFRGILFNTIPLCITIPLILFILKKKKQDNLKTSEVE